MKKVLEGSHAVSEAVRLAKVQMIAAYPITPQSHIVEALSEFCAEGSLKARFLTMDGEHSAMAAVIGASTTGVRTFTATSSHGLALMHEMLHWAAGARLPIVMAEVNRALGPGWNIWMDQSDSLAQRDTGWIQLYCEDGQEVLDTTLQAFMLAEKVNLPVMVVLDAFFLSHTYEPVDVPDQEAVDRFLPPFAPKFQLDPQYPCAIGQLTMPSHYMEMRHNMQQAMQHVQARFEEVEAAFDKIFGRTYGPLESVCCEDAEIIMIMAGTTAGTCREVVDNLRAKGEKVGLIKLKLFRPFPYQSLRDALGRARKVAVVDRNCSFGVGGIFCHEIKAALCHFQNEISVYGYITGLGGRDVTPEMLEQIYCQTRDRRIPEEEPVWIGLRDMN